MNPEQQQGQQIPINPQIPNLDQYYQFQQQNQQGLKSSVSNLQGMVNEQLMNMNPLDSDHPIVALFHILFKATPILCYYFLGVFIKAQWTVPEVIVCICAIDFWFTKNVSGRLLVGLRWWEEIEEVSGKSIWVFECRVDESQNSKVNEGIFWSVQLITVVIWVILGIANVLTLSIINTMCIGFTLLSNGVQKVRAKQLVQVLGADMIKKMINTSAIWPMKNPSRVG